MKRAFPIFLSFLVMGFGDVVGTLVGFATREFTLSKTMAGLLPLVGFIAFGIISVPTGMLQARLGKKRILLGGLAIALLGLLLPIISIQNYMLLLFAILMLGAGMAILQVAGNPLMRDVSSPETYSRNLSFAQFIKAAGSLSGPLLTALVFTQWYYLFPGYAAVTLLALAAVFTIKEPSPEVVNNQRQSPVSLKESFILLKNKTVLRMVLGLFLYVGAEVGMNSWLATFLHQNHQFDLSKLATIGIGFFFVALLIGRFMGAIVLNWLKPRMFFIWTSVISIIGLFIFLWGGRSLAIAAVFIVGLGFANIFPLIFSILINDLPQYTDPLSGLMVMAIVGGAIMPFFMGMVADISILYAFFIPLLSMIYILWVAVKTRNAEEVKK